MNTCPRCRRTYADGVRFCPADGSLVATVVDPYLGKTLMGQFHLVSLAGKGAMGTVYRAQQAKMDRTVAVKVLRGDLLKDDTAVKRFLREARAAARLNHPNIVTVHMVGESDEGVPFIVMEFLEGETLGAICDKEKVFEPRRALHVTRQIASALAEAHAQGIVHRDLKADNIILSAKRHEHDAVKVLDFGIAKLLSGEGGEIAQLTRDGTIFGTPHYIAPEQASGQEVDGRADLYSLGVILFRMVTGRLPFDGNSGMQVLMRHLRELPPRPRAIRPELPETVQDLILTALEKDRDKRWRSAEAFIAALDVVEKGLIAGNIDASKTLMGIPLPPRGDGRNTGPTAKTTAPAQEKPPEKLVEKLLDPAATIVMKPLARDLPLATPARAQVAARLDDPSQTRAGEQGLDAWAERAEEAVQRAGELDPEFSTGAMVLGPRAQRRRKMIWAAAGGATLLLGAVGFAALHKSPPAPPPVVEAKKAPDSPVAAPLVEERVTSAGGYAIRAGFEKLPASGEAGTVHVFIADDRGGKLVGARASAGIRGGGEHEDHVPLVASGDGYSGAVTFRAAGRHHLRVTADPPGGHRFTASLDFDVFAPQAPEVSAPVPTTPTTPAPTLVQSPASRGPSRPRHDRGSGTGDDNVDPNTLPVTVIPAGPAPGSDIRPHALGPAPGSAPQGSAAPSPAPRPSPPVSANPTPSSGTANPPAPAGSDDPYQLLDTAKP